MARIKTCATCRHQQGSGEYSKCRVLPRDGSPNLVTGVIRDSNLNYCSVARNWDSLCGESGKLWSPKGNFTYEGATTPDTPSGPAPRTLVDLVINAFSL